ncbi:MAG: SGNH/GDSL hydrolase family protein [Clostridia bacterium]
MKTVDIDQAMDGQQASELHNLRWVQPNDPGFLLAGFAFGGSENGFCRFPQAANDLLQAVNPALVMLSSHTSGGQLFFCTNSSELCIRVKLRAVASICHMSTTGECGFDAYAMEDDGRYHFFNAVKYDATRQQYSYCFFSGRDRIPQNFLLHFPLYCGVESLEIGLDADAQLYEPPQFAMQGRVVLYGTSITQGGCASRPGMSYPNLLSRMLGIEMINFGFSGNGNGEPEIAQLVASVPNVRLLILDYEANAGPNGTLEQTFDGFIDIFREHYPTTPILVLGTIPMPMPLHSPAATQELLAHKAFMQRSISQRNLHGDSQIAFMSGEALLGEDWWECTVDGTHPTDLGFYRMAAALAKPVQALLLQTKNASFQAPTCNHNF